MKHVGGAALALAVAFVIDGCHDTRPRPETSPRAEAPTPSADQPSTPRPEVPTDYELARRSFHTKLLRTAPSPQPFEPTAPGSDARQFEFDSDGYKLRAWISEIKPAVPAPAVLFLHGGFAFGSDDWAMAQPFRDAGFIVMVPIRPERQCRQRGEPHRQQGRPQRQPQHRGSGGERGRGTRPAARSGATADRLCDLARAGTAVAERLGRPPGS